MGSSLIGQSFTDADGNPLPQYFQSRPSAAGDGYDPLATSASNLGPESIVDTPGDPSLPEDDNGQVQPAHPGLLSAAPPSASSTASTASRPFCTGGGVGAVLSVIGPRDARGNVVHPTQGGQRQRAVRHDADAVPRTPTRVCASSAPSSARTTASARSCRSAAARRPTRRCPPTRSPPAAAAWTRTSRRPTPTCRSHRVAKARGVSADQIRQAVADHTDGRTLGFFGEPRSTCWSSTWNWTRSIQRKADVTGG